MLNKIIVLLMTCAQYSINAQKIALEIADSLYVYGKYTKAIEAYKASKDLAIAYPKIAKSYIAIGNLEQAKTFYKKSVEFNPNDMLIKYDYAVILGKTKAIKEATEVFNELIEKDNTNPNYYYQLGLIKEKSRDTLALEQFLLAYKYDNTHQKTIFKIAKHYLKKRNHKLSHKYIDKGLEAYAHNLSLMSLKAQNFYYQEYYDSAVVWFKKLIELGEESEFIHEKLSLSYAQNSDYNEAIEHAEKVLKYSPNDSRTLYLIGTYYERLQKN